MPTTFKQTMTVTFFETSDEQGQPKLAMFQTAAHSTSVILNVKELWGNTQETPTPASTIAILLVDQLTERQQQLAAISNFLLKEYPRQWSVADADIEAGLALERRSSFLYVDFEITETRSAARPVQQKKGKQ